MLEEKTNEQKLFLETIWNDVLVALKQRKSKPEPRTHIWAGEIGKNFWERYMKMTGVPPTEELEPRVLGKFAMGDMIEDMFGNMLSQIGIIRSAQEHIEIPEDDAHLRVTGRIDYMMGLVDWETSRQAVGKIVENNDTEESRYTQKLLLALVDELEKKYPKGFDNILFEIKSINSMVFWAKKEYLEEAYPFHIMQLYTYLKAKNMSEGRIVYFSKDDATIKEMTVKYPNKELEDKWQKDTQAMSQYIRDKQEPPRPENVIFDERSHYSFQKNKVKYKTSGCWKMNWEIEWSAYFTKLTDCKDVKEWQGEHKAIISERNKQLKEDFIKANNL